MEPQAVFFNQGSREKNWMREESGENVGASNGCM